MTWEKVTIRVEWDKESDDVYQLPETLTFSVRWIKTHPLSVYSNKKRQNYQSQLEKCVMKNEKEYDSKIISIEEEE